MDHKNDKMLKQFVSSELKDKGAETASLSDVLEIHVTRDSLDHGLDEVMEDLELYALNYIALFKHCTNDLRSVPTVLVI